ncbi:hypothetical protein [Methylohalobius crimeensis]|uniref:hypothetical protein n=1 Tax=Methylohalobius crimeensis TaxID=244365 RepID=UPI0003FC8F49|nr:hypothetical protein [Methylohalobius crimeensis]
MAMTVEEREKLIKRVLPALVIGVIYFTFAKGFVEKGSEKAEEEWRNLARKGISAASIPNLQQRMGMLDRQLAEKQQNRRELDEKVTVDLGSLGGRDDANRMIARLQAILAEHDLQVVDEGRDDGVFERGTRAVTELKQILSARELTDKIHFRAWRVSFYGRYVDVHAALRRMADDALLLVPLDWSMQEPENENETRMLWTLTVWI